ncbi:SDR family NAD(P)-dependent oxidoreductase [Streptomyces sp. INA 01156]
MDASWWMRNPPVALDGLVGGPRSPGSCSASASHFTPGSPVRRIVIGPRTRGSTVFSSRFRQRRQKCCQTGYQRSEEEYVHGTHGDCRDRHRWRVRPRRGDRGCPRQEGGDGLRVRPQDLQRRCPRLEHARRRRVRRCRCHRPDAVREAVARAAAGTEPLRVVVNCAGIAPSERILGKRGVHSLDAYAKVIGVNLVGSFNVMTLAAEQIAKTSTDAHGQRGLIVNTASIAAYDGQIGQAAYSSSKGGIVGLTLPAARDLAQHGIRVMTIAPGVMLTPMMEIVSEEYRASLAAGVPFPSRLGDVGEYAMLVLSIVDNDYLNGEVIRIDGALRMAPR